MSKRKSEVVHSAAPRVEGATAERAATEDASAEADIVGPSAKVRRVVSGLIAAHFAALGIALSANLAPSFLHGEILPWLAPVHVTTAQDYVLLPLELTHAARIDLPLVADVRLVRLVGDGRRVGDGRAGSDTQWRRIPLPQLPAFNRDSASREEQVVDWSSSRSRWPNLSRLVTWIALEQPDSEVLPEFALQLLRYAAAHESAIPLDSVDEIRLLQPRVLTYDDRIMLKRGQAGLLGDALQGELLYAAKVIRTASGELRLLPLQEPAMTSKPISTQPISTQPLSTQPLSTQPLSTQPLSTQPAKQPGVTAP